MAGFHWPVTALALPGFAVAACGHQPPVHGRVVGWTVWQTAAKQFYGKPYLPSPASPRKQCSHPPMVRQLPSWDPNPLVTRMVAVRMLMVSHDTRYCRKQSIGQPLTPSIRKQLFGAPDLGAVTLVRLQMHQCCKSGAPPLTDAACIMQGPEHCTGRGALSQCGCASCTGEAQTPRSVKHCDCKLIELRQHAPGAFRKAWAACPPLAAAAAA
jgi:hypothetical protein